MVTPIDWSVITPEWLFARLRDMDGKRFGNAMAWFSRELLGNGRFARKGEPHDFNHTDGKHGEQRIEVKFTRVWSQDDFVLTDRQAKLNFLNALWEISLAPEKRMVTLDECLSGTADFRGQFCTVRRDEFDILLAGACFRDRVIVWKIRADDPDFTKFFNIRHRFVRETFHANLLPATIRPWIEAKNHIIANLGYADVLARLRIATTKEDDA